MEDMVSKCLGKTPKSKKLKTTSRVDFDPDTRNWVVEVAYPLTDKEVEDPTIKDFTIEKVNLGATSRVVDVRHLEASTKKIITRTLKDEKDKKELKQTLRLMV